MQRLKQNHIYEKRPLTNEDLKGTVADTEKAKTKINAKN